MEKAFDKASLSHMDVSMRTMVERSYDLCLHRCMEIKDNQRNCKNSCFQNTMLPYRHANHMARDSEEGNYRKCLGKRPSFPALEPEDFTACSNDLFKDRIELMSNHVADEATKVFQISRS